MLTREKLILTLALVVPGLPAIAGPVVYVVTGAQQFGTVNLTTGTFAQIGPNTPEGDAGLVPGPNGSLLTLTYSGNLDSINPATGATTVVGATGLGNCTTPASPCGPTSANVIAELGGKVYATDYAGDLYTVNPLTGASTLVGLTGIPSVPFVPFSMNPDGSFNFFGEALFGAGGSLYATFDTGTENPVSGTITPLMAEHLYRIDPSTGQTTVIGPTAFSLDTVVGVNGTYYAFENATSQLVTLNLANGSTNFFSNVDPAAGLVFGASPTPEPGSFALAAIGIAVFGFRRLRRRA